MENCKTKQLVHTRLHASMPDVMSFLDKAPYNANNGGKEMKEQQQRQNQEEERQTRPKRNNFDASTGMISQDDDDSTWDSSESHHRQDEEQNHQDRPTSLSEKRQVFAETKKKTPSTTWKSIGRHLERMREAGNSLRLNPLRDLEEELKETK